MPSLVVCRRLLLTSTGSAIAILATAPAVAQVGDPAATGMSQTPTMAEADAGPAPQMGKSSSPRASAAKA